MFILEVFISPLYLQIDHVLAKMCVEILNCIVLVKKLCIKFALHIHCLSFSRDLGLGGKKHELYDNMKKLCYRNSIMKE